VQLTTCDEPQGFLTFFFRARGAFCVLLRNEYLVEDETTGSLPCAEIKCREA
jgi:hypothetical protein